MRRTRFYIIILLLFSGITNSLAQQYILSQKYSLSFNSYHIETALDSITEITGISFSYNPSIIDKEKIVTANFSDQPLIQILQHIFQDPDFSFKEVCSYIAITRKIPGEETSDFLNSYIDSSEYFYLKGKVLDKSDKKPIPFANILIKGKNVGTISNLDGNFTLKIPSGCIRDSLVVSFIGYKTETLNVSTLNTDQIIAIEPVSTQLNEVIVKHFDPKLLIKMALNKIGENYSKNPELQLGFYRETSRQNKDYIVISEAVLKILKASYDHSYKTDQVIVYKNRKSPFVKSMDTVQYKLQGGIYNSLMIDLAKHPASFISEDYFDMYNYKFEGVTQYDNNLVYVVSFDQKPEVTYPLYKGKLYIDKESLAFVKADFGISPLGLNYATSLLVKKSSKKIKAKVLDANYLVSYSYQEDKWRLHHVREEIRIRVRKKYSFFNSTYQSVSELVITDSDSTTTSRFNNSDLIKSNHIFSDVRGSYDETYWGKFNFIQPEISIEEAYVKIKDALKENEKTN